MELFLAAALRPLGLLLLLGALLAVRMAVIRWVPDCRLKRLLLLEL